ncbi:putative disease resistance protein RGA4 [Setaria italica]|uniref:putative disease resistance protein RGA4 n=1 Tax=Setaria italica TaxID=4555 RepID=UPI000BE55493|nr:putative disease resistance protein RGA4 [Setaria italica]XP_022679909.1 putative disease resistance protein RGA4 [Setaria italica]
MAEVLATMVVGPLVSMVKEKASSYLLDQYQVMEGMEEQHKLLKRKLPAILDVIADAEQQAAKQREGAKAWLEEVRTVAYKANDVLDEFKYEALRRKAKAEGHYKALGMDVIKLFPSHNRFVFRYKMAKRLCMILQEIDVLVAEMNAFRFKFKPQPQMPMQWRQTDACIATESVGIAIESRAQETKHLVDRLLAEASSMNLMVLPIVGMGGLGKTTLAQLVYNDPKIQKHFELRLWVCVSNDFDVDSLANRIVKENGCQASGSSSALDNLQKAVSGKRYLLVLDDVWNRDEPSKWERLKSYLQHGGSGSSVLTTTRDEAVAKLMMGTTEGAYKLGSLDEESLGKIIKARAFGSKQEKEWPGELVNMVGEVAKRCAGSPLAATALGSFLGTKTRKQEWEDVLNGSTICDEENGILPVLKLSYNCLPSYMRQCFAFCAMFPKDYEIDVQMLIHLWMANGFIPEQSKVCPETFGERIFIELKSRSFFQDLKNVPFDKNKYSIYGEGDKHRYSSRITCKIHDLMHDVAQSAMGEECAAIATHPSEREDVLRSARHLYLSIRRPETLLNASQEKGSPAFQTLISDGYVEGDLKILSKYNSIRALKIDCGSILRPKYLHHLRYLDLSESDIKALPEDISILYHLQTLNLSYCKWLERLPKELKYLTGLRHLYTHGCRDLKSMPTELGRLTSLQTLTYFVAGADDSGCSNLGELQNLDLGGTLELRKLENVTGADAQAAGLGNKKKLTELELCWTNSDQEAQNNNHKEVVEGLKPHDGLKALRITHCGSRTFPWMNTLKGMVELKLSLCKKLEELPALWELPPLQILHLQGLESLDCLCSGGTTPVTFPKLKVIALLEMAKFEAWWETYEVQGEDPVFPEVEELVIKKCKSLTALPKAASVITELSGRVDTKCRSAFPVLRKMTLGELTMFERWEAGEGISGEEVTFPQLEELSIEYCGSLSALPKGPLLAKQPFGGAETVCCRSAFPALRKLELSHLSALERWGAAEGTPGEEVTFPQLEELSISYCGSLSALPKGSLLAKQPFGGAKTVCCRSAFPALRKLILFDLSVLERWGAAEGTPGEEVTFPQLEELSITECGSLCALPKGPLLAKQPFGGAETVCCCSAFPALRKLELSHLSALERWGAAEGTPGEEVIFPQLEELSITECGSLCALPKGPLLAKQPFGGAETVCCRSAFPALRKLELSHLSALERWGAAEGTPGEEVTFPQLEELSITECGSLCALPKGPLLAKQPFDGAETVCCRSAFPALRKLKLSRLSVLERWGAAEGTPGEEVTFPQLERLSISYCGSLSALPKGPLLAKQPFGGAKTVCCRSAFPALRKLILFDLSVLERWGAAEGTPGEEVTFPLLEDLNIDFCPKLTDLPEAPKLSELSIRRKGDDQQQISLETASRCIPSLYRLNLDVSPDETETTLLHVKNKLNGTLALAAMGLGRCDLFFSSRSSALALWTCFAQLVYLRIWDCDALVYWPENVFEVLVCLRNLDISVCRNLTGRTQASDEQSAPAPERGGLLPCLESLQIVECKSLVEVPILPASLKELHIHSCSDEIESIVFCQQEDTRLVSGEGIVRPKTSSLIPGCNSSCEATASTAVLKLSFAANHRFLPFPCLEFLAIMHCSGLSEVANLPPSIKALNISLCGELQSLSGDLRLLEELLFYGCERLVSLPDGPQAYSSLRVLRIMNCEGIKLLPSSLQSRLGYLEEKYLDARYEELPEPTWKRSIRKLVCSK